MASDIITLTQLGEHNTQQDLWIAVHGKVYNLTPFAADHPGGIDVLKDCAGTDGSEIYEYAGHSARAMEMMQRFQVGSLAEYTANPAHTQAAPGDSAAKTNNSSKATESITPTMSLDTRIRVSLVVTVVGVLAGLYWGFGGVGRIGLKLGRGVDTAYAFLGGALLASSLTCAGWAFLYSQFSKTLEHEKEVFSYPPVIPRRRVRVGQ